MQIILFLPSVRVCHNNVRVSDSCHSGIVDVCEYSRVEVGQMLKIMVQNNIFTDEKSAFGNRLLGIAKDEPNYLKKLTNSSSLSELPFLKYE